MSPVQMPRQLQTLDDLLAQVEHYADHSMRNIGRVPTMLFPARPACHLAGIVAHPARRQWFVDAPDRKRAWIWSKERRPEQY
jgi:hypothetical protein